MGVPRIGRIDVSAALRDVGGPFRGPDAITRALAPPRAELDAEPAVSAADRRNARKEIAKTAAALADRIRPLPSALSEIAKRVTRHCAAQRGQAKDQELAAQLEALRDLAYELMLDAFRLSRAAEREA